MLHYEREYVEHLQKQIQKQAELIDSQFIVIRGLMNNCYKDRELINREGVQSKGKVV